MRIAMVGSRGIGSNYGGIERVLDELCPRLTEHGHEIDVFSAMSVPKLDIAGLRSIPTRSLGGKHLENISRSLLSTIQSLWRYDLVHFHATGPGILSLLTRFSGQKSVVTIHALDQHREKWGTCAKLLLRGAERSVTTFADGISVVSEPLRRYLRERYDREAWHIPNGMPRKTRTPAGNFLSKHGLIAGKYILFAGRLTPEKGCDDLISAFKQIKSDFKLAIAGGTGPADYASYLRQIADSDQIVFLGHIADQDLAETFSNAYLFVLPSYVEGMSMALLEAIAYRLPVLVSDIAENKAVVEKCGFQFPLGNIVDLQRRLETLLSSPSLISASRESMSMSPLPDWSEVAEKYDHFYRFVVGQVRKPKICQSWSAR